MADQDSPQAKPTPGQPSNVETKSPVGGRFGKIDLEDDDEVQAEESSLLTRYNKKKEENAEGKIRRLMEIRGQEDPSPDFTPYKQLWKAIGLKNWKEVRNHLDLNNPLALTSPISEFHETILHILVHWVKAFWLVCEIVDTIDSDSLGKTDYQDDTALSIAAYVGNSKAAEKMALKNPELLRRINLSKDTPFHAAARFGREKTFRCLLTVARTNQMDQRIFDQDGATILLYLISANLYGLAAEMLKYYPELVREDLKQRKNILMALAQKPLGFESACKFGIWERLIYQVISVTKEVVDPSIQTDNDDSVLVDIVDRDTQNSTSGGFFAKCWQRAYSMIVAVPIIKRIHKTKLMNKQARQLVKLMCTRPMWKFHEASSALKRPLLKAARLGIQEIVQEILEAYTASTLFYDENSYNVFQLAVVHRQEKVFNVINKVGLARKWEASYRCKDEENILHLTGSCKPSRHINGAALQMQREIQWFKVVEKFVHPLLLEERNKEKKTPREVFDDRHKDLAKQGEKWMRDTATSCMVVDALIIAMVFAAIIAVPGNNERGIPNFRHETLFKVFIISDAAALFSSSASLLSFVGILTSRYDEEDFLKALPKMLLLGLITLIFSIATMLVASCSALVMLIDAVPGPKVMLRKSTIIPVTILAILPVILFIWSQSHLLIDVFLSTYRSPILYREEDKEK